VGGHTDRNLARWRAKRAQPRQLVCLGDSITHGPVGPPAAVRGARGWVDQVVQALAEGTAPSPGDGFRGLWRGQEWSLHGTWTKSQLSDPFDVVPFGCGFFGPGTGTTMTWKKPAPFEVAAFDLYSFEKPGAGGLEYRVDGGAWTPANLPRDSSLRTVRIDSTVSRSVELRGDGSGDATVAGIATFTSAEPPTYGTIVHNIGVGRGTLDILCGAPPGDRLLLLDDLRPDLVTVLFSNDVIYDDPAHFGELLRRVVERVEPYADVLLINPFEQKTSPAVIYEGDLRIGQRERAMQAEYRAVTREIATEHGCAIVDLYDAWAADVGEGWDAANGAGLMHDDLHPSRAGHDDIFARVWPVIGG
jgi:lysophospholipase L1-like esterase